MTSPRLKYDSAKQMARDPDVNVRRNLARRTDLPQEILYYLAEDEDVSVRREVAVNPATPAQADALLARDADAEVRADLAQKIARAAPHLGPNEQDRLHRYLYEALDDLARDQVVRVRRILAESLRDVGGAPHDLIYRLAEDPELSVAAPVLEFSPVLTDQDLVSLIHSARVSGALSAISRRVCLGGTVADAIAETDDEEAIAALLANGSAQIREATLDHLIDQAPGRTAWHAPLVRRPALPPQAAIRLAQFVAAKFIDVLRTRGDLEADCLSRVEEEVRRRIAAGESGLLGPVTPPEDEDMARAEALRESDALTEAYLTALAESGDEKLLAACLALMGDLDKVQVRRALIARDCKGMTAISWAAGLSMRFAVALQERFGQGARLEPTEDGGYPLDTAEMEWQLELFRS